MVRSFLNAVADAQCESTIIILDDFFANKQKRTLLRASEQNIKRQGERKEKTESWTFEINRRKQTGLVEPEQSN